MSENEIEVTQVDGALADLVTRAEYDVQIATARKYPRSVKQFMNTAAELVTLNESVADDCIYALPRDGKNIEGPSARFAEIILHAWGHTRAGARVVSDDGRFITAQGVCHDLQNNTLIAYEVRRKITNKSGKRYNDDMIGVTGNAASSIALRNAILKVIPKALWSPIYDEAKRVVVGDSKTLANRRAKALELMQKFGATPEMVFNRLGVKGAEDITLDHLVILRGFANALKDGEFTVESIFNPVDEKQQQSTKEINDKFLKPRNEPEIPTGNETQAPTISPDDGVLPVRREEPAPDDIPQYVLDGGYHEDASANNANAGKLYTLLAMPERTAAELKAKNAAAIVAIKGGVPKVQVLAGLGEDWRKKMSDKGLGTFHAQLVGL